MHRRAKDLGSVLGLGHPKRCVGGKRACKGSWHLEAQLFVWPFGLAVPSGCCLLVCLFFVQVGLLFEFCSGGHLLHFLDKHEATQGVRLARASLVATRGGSWDSFPVCAEQS